MILAGGEKRALCPWVDKLSRIKATFTQARQDWRLDMCVWDRDCERARWVQWEQFSDLHLAHRVMLFIFVPLCVSVWVQFRCSGTHHTHQVSSKIRKKEKNSDISLNWRSILGQLYLQLSTPGDLRHLPPPPPPPPALFSFSFYLTYRFL